MNARTQQLRKAGRALTENYVLEIPAAEELEKMTGGVTHPADGVVDFISWIACGFHHNYKYTGKKQTRLDLFWHVTFYQRICQDCGHVDWTRSAP